MYVTVDIRNKKMIANAECSQRRKYEIGKRNPQNIVHTFQRTGRLYLFFLEILFAIIPTIKYSNLQ